MRVMVLVKATAESEAGVMPSEELLTRDDGLQRGAGEGGRDAGRRGPAPELEGRPGRLLGQRAQGHRRPVRRDEGAARRLLDAGRCKSLDEAIEWVKRVPNPTASRRQVEIRPVFEADDFGDELTPELREQEARLRAQTEANR